MENELYAYDMIIHMKCSNNRGVCNDMIGQVKGCSYRGVCIE